MTFLKTIPAQTMFFDILPHDLHLEQKVYCVGYLTFIAPKKHSARGSLTVRNAGFYFSLRSVLANNAFHSLPLLCFLSVVSATHLMLIWQPPQCTIESSWLEITLGKGSRSALQLCWRQWHNSNTNHGAGFARPAPPLFSLAERKIGTGVFVRPECMLRNLQMTLNEIKTKNKNIGKQVHELY